MNNNSISNLDVEQAILGSILINNDAYELCHELLEPEHFSEPIHSEIYTVLGEFISDGRIATPVTIKNFIPADKEITDGLTVFQYVARLSGQAAMPLQAVPQMAAQVSDLYKLRRLQEAARSIQARIDGLTPSDDAIQIGEDALLKINEILAEGQEVYGSISYGEATKRALKMSNSAYKGDKVESVDFGFPPLARLIGNATAGQFIVLGGGTKQGKTALAGQMIMGAALSGVPVWVYSGEMTAEELTMRDSSRETGVTVKKQKSGRFTEDQYAQMMNFATANKDLPIFIRDKELNLDQIEQRVKAFRRKKGFCVIVIDHLGLVARRPHEMRLSAWEFGEIVTGKLKQIAKDNRIVVVGLAQLKKNTFHDDRGMITEATFNQILSRRPRYSDLIGNIERDSDHVIIPFRPVVFLMEKEPVKTSDLHLKWEDLVKVHKEKAELILALSRENSWPKAESCGWVGKTTSFIETGAMNEIDDSVMADFTDNPMKLL